VEILISETECGRAEKKEAAYMSTWCCLRTLPKAHCYKGISSERAKEGIKQNILLNAQISALCLWGGGKKREHGKWRVNSNQLDSLGKQTTNRGS